MTKTLPAIPAPTDPFRRFAARLLYLPTVCWTVLLGRVLRVRHWWDTIDDHVMMGAFPFPSDVAALQRAGVGGVVNTCDEYAGPAKTYEAAGIEQLWVPTIDFTPPTLEAVEKSVQFMHAQIALGRKVYVHCKAGRARSATVVLCYLIAERGMTPEQAQQRILECRSHAHRHLPERPVVQQFWQRHQAQKARDATAE